MYVFARIARSLPRGGRIFPFLVTQGRSRANALNDPALGLAPQLADRVIVRWDVRCRDIEAYMGIQEVCQEKLADLIIGVSKWNRWNWREILLRRIDTLGLAPTLVSTSDQDEQFSEGVKDDLDRLLASDRKALMFKYEMVTCDGANVPLYPGEAHMKAYKWQPGLSYRGYRFLPR